jgi:hypothetical protein
MRIRKASMEKQQIRIIFATARKPLDISTNSIPVGVAGLKSFGMT